MKEKKYMNDWETSVSLDEKTGRDRRTPVYRGTWSVQSPEGRKTALLLSGAGCLGFWFCFVLYMLLDFPGTRVLYVFLPLALAVFPGAYWIMGLYSLARAPLKMTRVQREKSLGRMRRCAVGAAVFCFVASVGDLILLFRRGTFDGEGPGFLLLLAADAVCLLSARAEGLFLRGLEEESPAEA